MNSTAQIRFGIGRVTVARVDAALNAVVDRAGVQHVDFQKKFIGSDGKPACLVGRILAELGVTTEDFYGHGISTGNTSGLLSTLMLDIEPVAAMYLVCLQDFNDSSRQWGHAREVAWQDVQRRHADEGYAACSCCGSGYWNSMVRAFRAGPTPSRGERVRTEAEPVPVRRTFDQVAVDAEWAKMLRLQLAVPVFGEFSMTSLLAGAGVS